MEGWAYENGNAIKQEVGSEKCKVKSAKLEDAARAGLSILHFALFTGHFALLNSQRANPIQIIVSTGCDRSQPPFLTLNPDTGIIPSRYASGFFHERRSAMIGSLPRLLGLLLTR
jgi:hypothetical protein